MQLLDLPFEIFAEIIHAHVLDVGWVEAINARYICKAFASAIHHDMFARHRLSSFHVSGKFSIAQRERLLERNMHTFLLNLSRKYYNNTYILDHMDATITFLMKFSYDRSSALRMRYKATLCNAIAAALPLNAILLYLDHGPYDKSKKVRANMSRSDTTGMLAAAAAVNSLPALRFWSAKYVI
jgi:hypothetical protein